MINDTYVYPDFNGVDWDAVQAEFRQRIEAGLDNAGFYMAMYEMITRLGDEHSFYLSPEAVAEEEANYAGQHDYVGIGVLLSAVPERNRAVILSVFTGSPAEAAGLQPRDAILSVDGTPILDEEGYLRDIVRGPEGTTITLVVQTPGARRRADIGHPPAHHRGSTGALLGHHQPRRVCALAISCWSPSTTRPSMNRWAMLCGS